VLIPPASCADKFWLAQLTADAEADDGTSRLSVLSYKYLDLAGPLLYYLEQRATARTVKLGKLMTDERGDYVVLDLPARPADALDGAPDGVGAVRDGHQRGCGSALRAMCVQRLEAAAAAEEEEEGKR
jgi:hypothetical protein